MSSVILLLVIVGFLISLLFYEKYKMRKTLKRLNEMLERGINGSFSEDIFDETLLSAIETNFYQFLQSNNHSREKMVKEKENIHKLISDISHQTKTPLSNILLYTQLLLESNTALEDKELLDALSTQSNKLKFLIDSLVKSSRLEADIIKITAKNNSIQELVELAIAGIKMEAKQKDIKVIDKTDNEYGVFDMKWSTEAIFNILDNAVKYSPKGSRVTISTKSYEFFCSIQITDEGIGIPKEDENKIFSRFYRSPAVAELEGVGIGLYLAREIVTEQGGYIRVESNNNKGSVFKVYLPK